MCALTFLAYEGPQNVINRRSPCLQLLKDLLMTDWQTKSPTTDRLTDREITATIPFFRIIMDESEISPYSKWPPISFFARIFRKNKRGRFARSTARLLVCMNSESFRETTQCHGRDTDTKLDPKRISPRRGTWRRAEATNDNTPTTNHLTRFAAQKSWGSPCLLKGLCRAASEVLLLHFEIWHNSSTN